MTAEPGKEHRGGFDQAADEVDEFEEQGDVQDVDSPDLDLSQLDEAAAAGDLISAEDDAEDLPTGSLGPDVPAFMVDTSTGEVLDRPRVAVPAQPELARQLSSAVPLLLLAKSHQLAQQMPSVARVATRVTRGQVGIGVVVRLPSHTPDAAQRFLDHFSGSPIRIADPDLYKAPAYGGPDANISPQMASRHPWLMAASPGAARPDPAWVREVLGRQTDVGATVLLSATGWVSTANGAREISRALRWAAESRVEAGPTPMFVNLTLDGAWLTEPPLRAALLHEIIESGERLWYLRFRWPVVQPRYGQLRQRSLLEGYRELAVTAALEDKVLVLPNSGLTGWVAAALGAAGFSTGPSWPEQAYAAPQIVANRPGQRRPPPTLRLFERTVLHTVDHASHVAMLGEANYQLCRCRYCTAMGAATTSAARWNREAASMHYLLRCARLTALLASPNRRMEALREVRRAQAFMRATAGTPAAPTGNNAPAHLVEWERLLI